MVGPKEIILILVVVLILFGARKIPEFAKSLGSAIKEFKKASKEIDPEINEPIEKTKDNKTEE